MTIPLSGSLPLANAPTVRPVIVWMIAMNCSAVATWREHPRLADALLLAMSTILVSAGSSASSMTHSSASARAKLRSDPGGAAPKLLLVQRDHRVGDVMEEPSAGLAVVAGYPCGGRP
jgi:hypothetical protein